ncbi:MAG: SDR family oxidoreductase [Phycisphaerae bacterium]|nr:SDR family oxidoreductase [Phycisphaerae bacterium]
MTGTRGFMGRNLLEAAARKLPHATFVLLARSEAAAADLSSQFRWIGRDRLRVVQGDIVLPGLGLSPGDAAQLAAVNEVWHLAASTSFDDREMAAIYEGNVVGTQNVLDVAAGLPKLGRFVHVSTAYVAGTHPGPIAEDELPPRGRFRNSYEATKWGAELAVRQSGLPFVIFRPSIIMGDSRTFDPQGERRMIYGYMLGVYYSVLRECKRRRIDFDRNWPTGNDIELEMRLLGNPGATKNFVCIDDVTASVLHILDTGTVRKTYHLTSARSLDGMTMWRCVSKALRINGLRYVGETIENPTPLERNVMSYTAPFLPYSLNPDPVWLLTNTDKALGWRHARTPMNEAILTGLLERFMEEEVAARQAPVEASATFPEAAVMLAGV